MILQYSLYRLKPCINLGQKSSLKQRIKFTYIAVAEQDLYSILTSYEMKISIQTIYAILNKSKNKTKSHDMVYIFLLTKR